MSKFEHVEAHTIRVGDTIEDVGTVRKIEGWKGQPIESEEDIRVFFCEHPNSPDEQIMRWGGRRVLNVERG